MTSSLVSAGKAAASQAVADLVDAMPGISLCGLDSYGRVMVWNKAAEALLGWPSADIIGLEASVFIDLEGLSGASSATRVVCRHRDGRPLPCEVTLFALPPGTAVVTGLLLRDATASIAEEAFRMAASVKEPQQDATMTVDMAGRITAFNSAAEAMFGYTSAEVIGRNVGLLMPPRDAAKHDAFIARYAGGGEPRVMGRDRKVVGRRKDGTIFPHTLVINETVVDGQRMITGVARDIAAPDPARDRLAEIQAELLHLSRIGAMGSLAATLAHELNQPITAVLNYVETVRVILKDEGLSAAAEIADEALGAAAREAIRAGEIIRRLREFVARGETRNRPEELSEIIESACLLGLVGANSSGVDVVRDFDHSIGQVMADRIQTEQVLINLLRNALESMADSPVKQLLISTHRTGAGTVQVSVADTGPGFAPGIVNQLFNAFVTTKNNGMGLGLSICRTIVESQGGRIWAESNTHGGATFHFTLRLCDDA
jgi:two-component system sensor kinase FixL